MAKAKTTKAGKLNLSDMRALINKRAGLNVAHDLTEQNPTEVKEWIPTGSRWLDSIICRGKTIVSINDLMHKYSKFKETSSFFRKLYLKKQLN